MDKNHKSFISVAVPSGVQLTLYWYKPISQREKLVYNGEISDYLTLLFIKNWMDVPPIVQDLGYKVCAIISPKVLHFELFILAMGYHHYTPTDCCYVARTSEIRIHESHVTSSH